MDKQSNEPLIWSLFAVGGEVTAFVLPVMIFVTGIAVPFGIFGDALAYDRMLAFLGNPLVAFVLFGIIMVSIWHAMYRIYRTLFDLGVRSGLGYYSLLCNGIAAVVTLTALVVLVNLAFM